jgi:predicted regulator of Ras-like GTPase activity (Roadblock/LC7/MglB family)
MPEQSDALRGEMARLEAAAGVRLVVAASARDGLVVHAVGGDIARAPAVAALFAALFRRARTAAEAHGHGQTRVVRVRSETAHVLAAERGEEVLVVVADNAANVGRLRLELLRTVGSVA